MAAHLHQPDIDRLATLGGIPSSRVAYRHLDDCELCLRRLIDEVLRLASEEDSSPASARSAFTSAANN